MTNASLATYLDEAAIIVIFQCRVARPFGIAGRILPTNINCRVDPTISVGGYITALLRLFLIANSELAAFLF